MGRFLSRDTWAGDYNRPGSLNRWMYTEGNPVNLTDPSGNDPYCKTDPKLCALLRMEEIIKETDPNRAEALFRLFEDQELFNSWGDVAGRDAGSRLTWVLQSTRSTILPMHFYPLFEGDCGFAEEFRDDKFYSIQKINQRGKWSNPEQTHSNQVGHFLTSVSVIATGVAMGLDHLEDITGDWSVRWDLRAILGHEKLDDLTSSYIDQINAVTKVDILMFRIALGYDELGDNLKRDEWLWKILDFPLSTDFDDVVPYRQGNSLQDLRLSLKGYRFAKWAFANAASSPKSAGEWLRKNLSNP